jgi:16S rRNA (adenine1518-N6/adenine1519-N6)-dimethyltransferase
VLRDQTLALLNKHGLTADPTLDEQQLIDPTVIAAMIKESGLKPTDTVLEVGPGAGNITVELVKHAKKVYAIEKNPKFLPPLTERLAGSSAEVILGDALTLYLPPFDVLVSNIPYAIVEAMLQRLKRIRFRAAVLLVPISFATTITAKKGTQFYTKLSMEANLFYEVTTVSIVKQPSYYPEPKTETALVRIKPKLPRDSFEGVLWHLLQQGDKKVENALREALIAHSAKGYPNTKKAAKEYIDKLGLEDVFLEKRVAALSLADVESISARLEHGAV